MSNLEITYNSFINRISGVTKKDILLKLTKDTLLTLSIFILLALLLTGLEAIFGFSSGVRKVIFFIFVSSFFATILMVLGTAFLGYRNVTKPVKINTYALK